VMGLLCFLMVGSTSVRFLALTLTFISFAKALIDPIDTSL
jgi:hypothetical protein